MEKVNKYFVPVTRRIKVVGNSVCNKNTFCLKFGKWKPKFGNQGNKMIKIGQLGEVYHRAQVWPVDISFWTSYLMVDLRYWYPGLPPVPDLLPIVRWTNIKWLSVKVDTIFTNEIKPTYNVNATLRIIDGGRILVIWEIVIVIITNTS